MKKCKAQSHKKCMHMTFLTSFLYIIDVIHKITEAVLIKLLSTLKPFSFEN